MLVKVNEIELDEIAYSEGYANYIMDNCGGERVICNGDMLLDAQEEGYLLKEYLTSLGKYC